MALKDQILTDLKEAMKAKNRERLQVLRSLKAALLEKEIAERSGGEGSLDEAQEVKVLQKAAKQRRDSIEQYEDADREDLAAVERKELEIIEEYLPEMLSESEIKKIASKKIEELDAENMADMGKVMGAVMPEVKGKADGSLVNKVVRELLSS